MFDTRFLNVNTYNVSTMKRINATEKNFQQTPFYTRENTNLLTKEASIPRSEAAEQGVIATLHARGAEV